MSCTGECTAEYLYRKFTFYCIYLSYVNSLRTIPFNTILLSYYLYIYRKLILIYNIYNFFSDLIYVSLL